MLKEIVEANVHAYDIDGTLVDSFNNIIHLFSIFSKRQFKVEACERFIRDFLFIDTTEKFMQDYVEHIKKTQGVNVTTNLKDNIEVWNEIIKEHETPPPVFEGAVELLHYSKNILGKKTPLITSATNIEMKRNIEGLTKKAEELGLNDVPWDTIISYDDVKIGESEYLAKPNKYPMEVALEKMKLDPDPSKHKIIYVGDAMKDMIFANSFGGMGILISGNHNSEESKKIIEEQCVNMKFPSINVFYNQLKAQK